MHCRFPRSLAVLSAVIIFCFAAIHAAVGAETAVDLELIVAVDVSGSMDEEEHTLQRQGYVAAFRHPEVINTIMSGFIGRIAVTYLEWAGPVSQVVTVPWRIVDGKDSAGAFADILADEPIAFIRGTSISGGIEFAAGLFADNGIEGTRRVIDVSGDGANNMGEPVEAARDQALAQGIVINGLPLLLKPRSYFLTDGAGLDDYYRDCVIGGPGSFVIPVTKKSHLARAIRRKLLLEIAGPRARLYYADAPAPRAKVDCFIGEKIRRSRDDE
jgi:hypothetical protein